MAQDATTSPPREPEPPAGGPSPEELPGYMSSRLRAPDRPPLVLPASPSELTAPVYGHSRVTELDRDLTRQHQGEPHGQRIVVAGRVRDSAGRPVRDTLVEIWQANAGGRYSHVGDRNAAPLDPNFTGTGRCLTDSEGRYEFTTIKPGAYPWGNHKNGWRPAHIHFSLLGPAFASRLITQMYFPEDPLFLLDPIVRSAGDSEARRRLVSSLDLSVTRPDWALGYRFDIVVNGHRATPVEV
jgi:protocatechuate 3,4-dioxygenase, beta subunit